LSGKLINWYELLVIRIRAGCMTKSRIDQKVMHPLAASYERPSDNGDSSSRGWCRWLELMGAFEGSGGIG